MKKNILIYMSIFFLVFLLPSYSLAKGVEVTGIIDSGAENLESGETDYDNLVSAKTDAENLETGNSDEEGLRAGESETDESDNDNSESGEAGESGESDESGESGESGDEDSESGGTGDEDSELGKTGDENSELGKTGDEDSESGDTNDEGLGAGDSESGDSDDEDPILDESKLNNYEMQFIKILSLRYQYKGYYYIVDKQYINKVIRYLSKDGVDWTIKEFNEYLDIFLNNFDYGIQCGYMIQDGKIPIATPVPEPTDIPQDENEYNESQGQWFEPDDFEDNLIATTENVIVVNAAVKMKVAKKMITPTAVPFFEEVESEDVSVPALTTTPVEEDKVISLDTSDYADADLDIENDIHEDTSVNFWLVFGFVSSLLLICIISYLIVRKSRK